MKYAAYKNYKEQFRLIREFSKLRRYIVFVTLWVTMTPNVALADSDSSSETLQAETQSPSLGSALYPQATETRELRTLNGIWNFRLSPIDDPQYGHRHKWFEQDLEKTGPVVPMPVPSSFNDISTNASVRYHVGFVWYDRRFYVPKGWAGQRVVLRFGSVHYFAEVWVNGISVTHHEIGHLPFEVEISAHVRYNDSNLLTVAVNNTLTNDTIPSGSTHSIEVNHTLHTYQQHDFDFFNYAGIHRTVFLYSTPQAYIDDITVETTVKGSTGHVYFSVAHKGSKTNKCLIELFDAEGKEVARSQDLEGSLDVINASLWWPFMMHPDPGYLYTMKVSLKSPEDQLIDKYYQRIGIRAVTWNNTNIFINNKPLYLRGFSLHEDSDLHGRGWDAVVWVRNFNLIRWTGANAFRTSHYPYTEEVYQLADEQGIMIIDESPSTNDNYTINTERVLAKHTQSMTELIRRDKNHPSVIMWSICNAPLVANDTVDHYLSKVVKHVKSMDSSRPVTISYEYDTCGVNNYYIAKHVDVISFMMFEYTLVEIVHKVQEQAKIWHKKNNKPVLMSGYGVFTISGMHTLPEYRWSEDFQIGLLSEHFKAFDQLRDTGFFVGEFIRSFADIETAPSCDHPLGNVAGIFTRERQPKAAATHLRKRYHDLAGAPAQDYYISDVRTRHEEL